MDKRQRILYVEKPSFVGGSVTGLYDLVSGLDQTRFDPVVLFCGPNPYRDRFRQLGVQVETLSEQAEPMRQNKRDTTGTLSRYSQQVGKSYWLAKDFFRLAQRDYPVAKRVAKLIREQKIDLVHHNNCLRTNRATVLGARLARVPQIVHVRTLNPIGPVERYLARSVNTFVYMSRAVESHYRSSGIPADQGLVIYDGFLPPQTHTNGENARTQFGFTDQDFVISNVGRLEWWKGHEYFVQSIADVVQDQPHAKALLVGGVDPSMRNEEYFSKVQGMVQELGLANHVIFTGFRSDVPQIMAMSDLIVHSASEPEPFGRVVVEAMLAGRPVVATAAGGVLDIVEDNVTGLTVPPKDSTAMAGAIQYLLQHPATARTMGERAQQQASTRFSVEQHVKAVQSLYQKILS